MPCGCKQPVIRNPKPVPQQITVEEIDYFNNIDVITPIPEETNTTIIENGISNS